MNDKHGQTVLNSLKELEKRRKELLSLCKKITSAYGGKIYPLDLFAIGAIKRAISTIAGFRLLVESWNMVCARALLRMQIDTALRFYSAFLVKKPHDFVVQVLEGQQINRLKDKDGKFMTDAYLISKLLSEYPWLQIVYNSLSGYIHLSEHHLGDSVEQFNNASGAIVWEVKEYDTKFPDPFWVESIECFNESTDIFIKYLIGWIFTKTNPELVAELKKNLKIN